MKNLALLFLTLASSSLIALDLEKGSLLDQEAVVTQQPSLNDSFRSYLAQEKLGSCSATGMCCLLGTLFGATGFPQLGGMLMCFGVGSAGSAFANTKHLDKFDELLERRKQDNK